MVNTTALRQHIKNSGLKYKHIANQLTITPYGLQKKIENHTEFKASEITKLSDILALSVIEKDAIFFAKNVDFNSTNDEQAS